VVALVVGVELVVGAADVPTPPVQLPHRKGVCPLRPPLRSLPRHDPSPPPLRRRHLYEDDVRAFLNHLASDRTVAASTQNQALDVLLFLYEQVLGIELR